MLRILSGHFIASTAAILHNGLIPAFWGLVGAVLLVRLNPMQWGWMGLLVLLRVILVTASSKWQQPAVSGATRTRFTALLGLLLALSSLLMIRAMTQVVHAAGKPQKLGLLLLCSAAALDEVLMYLFLSRKLLFSGVWAACLTAVVAFCDVRAAPWASQLILAFIPLIPIMLSNRTPGKPIPRPIKQSQEQGTSSKLASVPEAAACLPGVPAKGSDMPFTSSVQPGTRTEAAEAIMQEPAYSPLLDSLFMPSGASYVSWSSLMGVTAPQPTAAAPPPAPYQSITGERIQVSIKLNTSNDLSDVPDQLGAVLAGRMIDSFTHQPGSNQGAVRLLSMAARSGCIMLDLDMTAESAQEAAARAHSLLSAYLPSLTPLVRSQELAGGARNLVRFQMNDQVWYASWDASLCDWQVHQDLGASDELGQRSTSHQQSLQLGLIRHTATCIVNSTRKSSSSSNKPSTEAGMCLQPAANDLAVHQVVLQVQLLGASSETDRLTGWQPPAAHDQGGHLCTAPAQAPPALQLLATCEGHYLTTHVFETQHMGQACWEVVCDVPEAVMPHHHVGSPPVGVLPMKLQLVWNDLVADSAPVLLHLTPTVSEQPKAMIWWWGCTPDVMQAAMDELGHAAQVAWLLAVDDTTQQASADATAAAPSREFMHDLITWLRDMRELSCTTGQCAAGSKCAANRQPATQLARPALTLDVLQLLGTALAEHADQLGLRHVSAMIRQQSSLVVVPAATQLPAATAATRRPARSGWYGQLLQSAWGYSCSQCESQYRVQLTKHVSGLQPVASTAILGITSVCLARGVAGNWALAVWGSVHLTTLACCMSPQTGSRTSAQHLNLCAYMVRLLTELACCIGLTPVMPAAQNLYNSSFALLWAPLGVMLSLAEQVQLSTFMSAPRILDLTIVQALALTGSAVRCGQRPWWLVLAGNMATSILPRLLLDMRMRRVTRSSTVQAKAAPAAPLHDHGNA